MGELWKTAILGSMDRFLVKVLDFLPNLLAMVTILIIGLLVAWAVKVVFLRLSKAIQLDKVSRQWGFPDALSKGGVSYSAANLLSRFFYWVIVLVTLILGINALKVSATQNLIAQFFNYLPHLFAAVIILVIGYLIAIFLSRAVLITAVNAQMETAKLLAWAVRWCIIILSFTMALYQLGIAESVIMAAFSIIFGGVVLTLAIAFGWGGRGLAKNFLDRLYKGRGKGNEGQDHVSHI